MITENFIKQCEKADEIQKLCYYKKGDWFYTKKHRNDVTNGLYIISGDWDLCYANSNREDNWLTRAKGVWLPTQEQLQEMLNAYSNYERINRFYEFVHLDTSEYGWNKWCEFVNDSSMNELWLCYVMKKLYNKIWTGEKWKEVVNQCQQP